MAVKRSTRTVRITQSDRDLWPKVTDVDTGRELAVMSILIKAIGKERDGTRCYIEVFNPELDITVKAEVVEYGRRDLEELHKTPEEKAEEQENIAYDEKEFWKCNRCGEWHRRGRFCHISGLNEYGSGAAAEIKTEQDSYKETPYISKRNIDGPERFE